MEPYFHANSDTTARPSLITPTVNVDLPITNVSKRTDRLPPISRILPNSPQRQTEVAQEQNRHIGADLRGSVSPPPQHAIVQTHGPGHPLSPQLPEHEPSERPSSSAQFWRPSSPSRPTGFTTRNLSSYPTRMPRARFKAPRQPTQETYNAPRNPRGHIQRGSNPRYRAQYRNSPKATNTTFERGMSYNRQHPIRQPRGPRVLEDRQTRG